MKANERRDKIIELLKNSKEPITGKKLAETLGVSRQVIVQDMALLRAQDYHIMSMNSGYYLENAQNPEARRVFKVYHNNEQVEEELNLFVDYGAQVEDVFIYHKVYGIVSAKMDIHNRHDINEFVKDLSTGKSSLLMNVTSGYHYHTIKAPTEMILDLIQEQLEKRGFLAKLQDYEPVDFWKE